MNSDNLMKEIETELNLPISNLLRKIDSSFSSALDLFDPQLFTEILLKCLPSEVKGKLIKNYPIQANIQSFEISGKILKEAVDLFKIFDAEKTILTSEKLKKISKKQHHEFIPEMCILLATLFQIMLKNQQIIYLITEMEENDQIKIKDYIESQATMQFDSSPKIQHEKRILIRSQSFSLKKETNNQLYEKIDELEGALNSKEQELQKSRETIQRLEEDLADRKEVIQKKEEELQVMNKRMSVYSETDALFEEKDEEIVKLLSQVTDLKLKFRLKTTEQTNEINGFKEQMKNLQEEKNEIFNQYDRISHKYDILVLQKQEGQASNKKVIGNLKQKIKKLNERINEQQQSLLDVLNEKQLKEKEIFELEKKINPLMDGKRVKIQNNDNFGEDILKSSGRKSTILGDQIGGLMGENGNQVNLKPYFDILFGKTDEKCSGELCIALRVEYVHIVHEVLKLNNELDSINYFSPESRMECLQTQLQRIANTFQENMKLKQKIVLLQHSDALKGQPHKQSQQEINKLKKKLLILKRKLDEAESQKKDELQILVSAFSESISLPGKN